jgi:hypothetical protein
MEGLDDLQQKILLGVKNDPGGDTAIKVSRLGPDVIEVRAGSYRWYGKQAVNAVVGLMVRGLVTRAHRNSYELTEQGSQLSSRLLGAIAPGAEGAGLPQARRDVNCSRCKQRLRPGAPRCHLCGTRAPSQPLTQ